MPASTWRVSKGWREKAQPEGIEQQRFIALRSELAVVGQGGLQIISPAPPAPSKTFPAVGLTWP
jgi:hypothetical protein